MRLYLAVFACGLRRYSTYRAATAAGVLTNSVFGIINAMVLLAVFAARPEIGGYDAADAVTHVFVAQACIGPVAIFGPPLDLGQRIREGSVATDLLRPAPLIWWWFAHDLGRAAFSALFRSLPTFGAGLLVFPLLLPDTLGRWLAAAAALALATVIGFALRYLYALAGFWLVDSRGVEAASLQIAPFCSGMVLPLVLFPDPVAAVLRSLPWAALVQVPAEIFLGKTPIAAGLAYQATWAVALLALGAALTARAAWKVVVQGG